MPSNGDRTPTAYDVLAVHPTAPADLIGTAYWLLTGDLLKRRDAGEFIDDALHELTRAYESVSDPVRRSAYDAALGQTGEPLARRQLPRVRGPMAGHLDHYEVLGLSTAAPPGILPAAYQVMRTQYLRVPQASRRLRLLEALDDAYETLSVSEKRLKYDERAHRQSAEQSLPPVEDQAAPSRRPKGLVLRGLGRALAAGARLPKRGARNGQEPPAADPDTGKPKEHRVKEPAPPEPPVSREPPPRPRTYSIDVEEAFLQRIASYIEEIRLANGSAESGDGRDAPRNARS